MHANIPEMKIFVRAVETNSFVSAARSLLIDPAVVSRAIKALEADLGVRLFTRSTRNLHLTPEGLRFYRSSVQVLKKFAEATGQFREQRENPHGRVKIGMTPGLTRRTLLRVIPGFQQRYPQIELILHSIGEVSEMGEKGLDIILRVRSFRQHGGTRLEPQGLVARKLAQSHFIVCASPEYLQRAGVPRVPSDLLEHSCVALVTTDHDVQTEWQFAKGQQRKNVKFVPKLLVQGADGYREAGAAGCGIVRLLACNIDDEIQSGKLQSVLADWGSTWSPPIVAIYRNAKPMPPQVSFFVRYLAESFKCYDSKR